MVAEDVVLPGGAGNMGVDFGSGDVFMAEHFLDYSQIRSVLNQMRRKRMTEGVRRNVFPDTGLKCIRLNHFEYRNPAQTAPAAVYEKDVVIVCLWPHSEIGPDRIRSHFSHRHNSFLVTFSDNPHESVVPEYVRNLQVASLGNPQSAAVQDLENSTVPEPFPVTAAGGLDYRRHFLY